MEPFTTALATAFGIDPARIAAGTTDLAIDKVESLTGSTNVSMSVCMCVCCGISLGATDAQVGVTVCTCGHSIVDAE